MLRKILIVQMLIFIGGLCCFAQASALIKTLEIIKHPEKYPKYILVSAHRGYWSSYPENSLEAYRMAMELGADIIEMDVRLTLDDEMVVFHDACLDRITTGYGRLRESSWEYVNSLFLRDEHGNISKFKMLKLEEALDFLKDKAVIALDIKEGGALYNQTLLRVLDLLKQKGMLYQSVVKGKLPLSNLQELLNQVNLTLADFIYTPIAFSTTPDLDTYIRSYLYQADIHAIELVFKQSSDPILKYVSTAKNRNKWVGQYSFWPELGDGVIAEKIPLTDTDPIVRKYDFKDKDPNNFLDDGRGDWDWLIKNGANYIITDRSELLIDMLTKTGYRQK